MTKGMARRQAAADNLAGRQDMEPVMLQGPQVQSPRPVQTSGPGTQGRILQQLSKWGSGKLQQAAKTQQQRDMLEGQMAYQQNKTLEEVNMGGNKWALEGYRLMDAQTVSSSLLAAQREQINQGDYQMSPDEYRAQYVQRLEGATKDLDARTADLVRQQMTEQMGPLVADHTTAHLRHLEKENFQSLERSIDVVSRDPTATDQLVDFARGEADSPSSGLSPERRQAATVSGVVRAFDNDNPLAYSALAREGLLGDNLTSQEQNAIRAAQKRFEGRRRSEYNEELLAGEQTLMRRVEQGEIDPSKAVEELSVLYSDHGINMKQAEAGAIYDQAQATSRQADLTRGNLIREAGLRGDTRQQASIIFDSLTTTESSGNSRAHRTNKDGRQFGGLIQMGQARLDETLAMMGRGRMSVREYTALPAEQQREIGVAHIEDLAKAAQATGAIGSTINGQTVTLSGLVAVAHLGGKEGMRKFVETNGQYNKQDEEGTSLTDYLRKHASGERVEIMSAGERLQRSQDMLTKTRERLAIANYEQMAPKLYDMDRAFEQGMIDQQEWLENRRTLYEKYDYAATEADINHEVSQVRAMDDRIDANQKAAMQESEREAIQRAQVELAPVKAEWESVVSNPESTPEQIRAANQQYVQARNDTFSEYGVAFVDQGNPAASEEMITRTRDAFQQYRTRQEEQVRIDAAVNGRYLDQLPADLQNRAFEQREQEIISTYQNEVAEGRMSEDEYSAAVATDLNNFYAQSGAVPKEVRQHATGTLQNEWVDKEGNPNPYVVDVIQQYAEIKSQNPAAAKKFLSEGQMIRAEAVLSRSAGNPNLMGEAVRNIGMETSKNPLREDPQEYLASPGVQQEIRSTVDAFIRSEDFFRGDQAGDTNAHGKRSLRSEETREAFVGELENEVARAKRAMPNLQTEDLINHAWQNVEARSTVIGGDPVIMPVGSDVPTMFFGSRAPDFMHDGAVNSAVMEWLRSPEAQEQYPDLDAVTAGEFFHPLIQRGVDAALGAIPFSDWGFEPAMSNSDFRSTLDTGVRPFETFPLPNGNIGLTYLKPDGNHSDTIVIPARRAGEMYMKRRIGEMAQ